MGKHRWVMVAVGVVFMISAVAGCATPTGNSADRREDSATQSDPATGAPGTAAPGNPGPTDSGTKTPGEDPGSMVDPPAGTPMTLRGVATEGVEVGCVVMNAEDGNVYLLIGGDRTVINSGSRIEVQVHLQPDLMTTCQQGTPAVVVSARRI